jgi:hypothetical protein
MFIEAFTRSESTRVKDIGIFKDKLDIKQCPEYTKIWSKHFKYFK